MKTEKKTEKQKNYLQLNFQQNCDQQLAPIDGEQVN